MSRDRWFVPCALCTLSTLLSASDGTAPAGPGSPDAGERVGERGAPALLAWADFDGDTRLDLAVVTSEGRLQLLANAGDGRFEDATERAALAGVVNAAFPLWADYDGDGRADLFVGARSGASRLFRNEGGIFVDASADSGLEIQGEVRTARWLDLDGDGRLDLHAVTAETHLFFRGRAGGSFERSVVPLAGAEERRALAPVVRAGGPALDADRPAAPAPSAAGEDRGPGARGAARPVPGGPAVLDGRIAAGPSTAGATTPIGHFPLACASSLEDQASPGTCLEASSLPALGKLHPLSPDLFVAPSGEVGVGTTSPAARLDVAGTARIGDTLTLAPPGDAALDLSTGSLYKAGQRFLHTRGGPNNVALGHDALSSVTSGGGNAASGASALRANTTGGYNTAGGAFALMNNTSGARNTADGAYALLRNTTGSYNTACGARALFNNTVGHRNTASGFGALLFNTTGFRNTALGYRALAANTTGFANTATGALALRANFANSNTANGAYSLYSNTGGAGNVAAGTSALRNNTTGGDNTACGVGALFFSTTGDDNTAFGAGALSYNTTGEDNIALGRNAGSYLTTGSRNIDIGNIGFPGESATIRIGTTPHHLRAFISGIRGVTTDFANAIPVLVDSAGQLGTISSSARFKEEIRDMGDLTDRLLELRPVVFRYKPEVQAGERPLEYGLIAEEVAQVFPELVVYGDDGKPFTVKYHLLAPMLLNELKKANLDHARELREVRDQVRGLEARLASLESGTDPTALDPSSR